MRWRRLAECVCVDRAREVGGKWRGDKGGRKGEGKTLRRYCDGSDHSFLFMHGYKCCFCLYCSVSNIHRSATTSKPLTGDVNNLAGIYVNATWQRTTHPNFVVDLITTTHYQWQWPPPSRTMCPDTPQTLLGTSSRNTVKGPRCPPGLQLPQNPIWSSIYKMCWSRSDPWRPHPRNI